jgi:hypothetical protein
MLGFQLLGGTSPSKLRSDFPEILFEEASRPRPYPIHRFGSCLVTMARITPLYNSVIFSPGKKVKSWAHVLASLHEKWNDFTRIGTLSKLIHLPAYIELQPPSAVLFLDNWLVIKQFHLVFGHKITITMDL